MAMPLPDDALAVAPFLREIGRGRDGARGLSRDDARALMAAILDGRVGELELGGVLLALRMKGEEPDETAGFLDALDARLARAPARAPAWVVLPSYNGARRVANLVPLLACLLARDGLPVLVHGQDSEPAAGGRARVSSATIFAAMGLAPCANLALAPAHAAAGQPAYAPLASFAPALARLVALRPVLGVRNVAHTLAKLARPVEGQALLVSSFTHPDFGRLQAELCRREGWHAMSLRATEGEAVIGARRAQSIDHWRDGQCRTIVAAEAVAPAGAVLPEPDADSTARWTLDVLSGGAPVPAALQAQRQAIRAALSA